MPAANEANLDPSTDWETPSLQAGAEDHRRAAGGVGRLKATGATRDAVIRSRRVELLPRPRPPPLQPCRAGHLWATMSSSEL